MIRLLDLHRFSLAGPWLLAAFACVCIMFGPSVSRAASIPLPRMKPSEIVSPDQSRTFIVPRPNPRRAEMKAAIPSLVTGIRIGGDMSQTRFVLEITREIPFRIFTLADPYRVVIDFPEIGFQLPSGGNSREKGLVKAFRYGLFQPGNSRAVLDLKRPAEIISSQIIPPQDGFGYRLSLDLKSSSREAFLKAAGWPDPQFVLSPGVTSPITPVPQRKPGKLVVIDPGHGGIDPGAASPAVGFEKELVLEFAKILARKLDMKPNIQVALTRKQDSFLSLRKRVEIARSQGADLFISIHADTLPSPQISGASVYTLSETATDEEAAELAHGENQADVIAGVDLKGEEEAVASILITLVQRETNNRSVEFARTLVTDLRKITPVLPTGHRQAGFRVLKAPDIPSVLLELGFISNKKDSARLVSPDWRRKVASGVSASIAEWLSHQP